MQVQYKWPYEPYVIVPRSVPLYDERFIGYGFNKISHIYELHMAGFVNMTSYATRSLAVARVTVLGFTIVIIDDDSDSRITRAGATGCYR